MSDTPKDEPRFRHPPRWIHAAEAGNWLASRREQKKRAVIRLLDRIAPGRSRLAPGKKP